MTVSDTQVNISKHPRQQLVIMSQTYVLTSDARLARVVLISRSSGVQQEPSYLAKLTRSYSSLGHSYSSLNCSRDRLERSNSSLDHRPHWRSRDYATNRYDYGRSVADRSKDRYDFYKDPNTFSSTYPPRGKSVSICSRFYS